MMYRDHRPTPAESFETVIELPGTFDALIEHLATVLGPEAPALTAETVYLVSYSPWGDWIVLVDGIEKRVGYVTWPDYKPPAPLEPDQPEEATTEASAAVDKTD